MGKLFVVSAPSATGKTTLVKAVLEQWSGPQTLKKVVTYTTREPRVGEQDGIDYHFVSEETFKILIEEQFFIEWNVWCNHYYGSPRSVVQEVQGSDASFIAIVDQEGAFHIKGYAQVVLIWIVPPSLKELKTRISIRGNQSLEEIEARLVKAQEELAREEQEHMYKYHVINDVFSETVTALLAIITKEIKEK